MRTFLHKLMVDITRNPREYITPTWSSSIVVNAFRVYEYWFGRRAGIRVEGSTDAKGIKYSYTWENLCAVYEDVVRKWLKGKVPKFSIVYIPQLQLATMIQGGISPFRFAIAFDNSQVSSSTPLSCTVTGSNGYMFAGVNSSSASGATGAFNSVAMTQSSPLSHWLDFFGGLYLASPTTGTHNLVVTNGNGPVIANTYSGCDQGVPDQYITTALSGAPSSITVTFTTSTANCWGFMSTYGSNTPTAGAGTTGRSLNNAGAGLPSSADSNGNMATGTVVLTLNFAPAGQVGAVGYKFLQVTAAAVNSGFFFAVDR